MNAPAAIAARAEWACRISEAWQRSAVGIIETGRLLIQAKQALDHGEFGALVDTDLPFSARTAQRLMAIAADERLSNATHVSLLPPSWGTMYELTKLDDEHFEKAVENRTIRPDVERSEVAAAVKEMREAPSRAAYDQRVSEGCTIADLHSLIADGKRFAAIQADPPWGFDTYSDKGQDRAPDYDTKTLEGIKALPVAKLAADDAALFLWCVMPSLPQAFEVITAWGFTYSTCAFVWVKQNKSGAGLFAGLGYWTRANAELCLLATRGNPKRIARDVHQVIEAPVGEHSRKPDAAHERIQRLVRGPYLELYARRERENWTTWGNEIPRAKYLPPHDGETGEIIDPPSSELRGRVSSSEDDEAIPAFLKRERGKPPPYEAEERSS